MTDPAQNWLRLIEARAQAQETALARLAACITAPETAQEADHDADCI